MSRVNFCDILALTDVSLHLLPYLSLKDLFVLRCASREVKYLVDNLVPHIRKLALTASTKSLHFLHILLPLCRRLRVISIRRTNCITDEHINQLLDSNRNSLLEVSLIDLNGPSISAACLQPVLLDACHRLHTLKLSQCSWLTDGSLECFLLHLNRNSIQKAREHSLRVVDLSACSQISSRVLNLFFKSRCLHLTTLNLSNMGAAVQDETLKAIASNSMGATIENLNLVNCYMVTGTGLKHLKSCPCLKALLCRGIDIEAIKSVVCSFPTTVFIDVRRSCAAALGNHGNRI